MTGVTMTVDGAGTEGLPPGAQRRPQRWWAVVALVVASMLVGAAVGVVAVSRATPGDASAEAGFARDMQVHHAQAVQMSMLVRDRTADDGIRLLAYDIATTQQQQIGQMYGWLTQWGLAQTSSRPAMAWMDEMSDGHSGMAGETPDASMPGMASAADIDRLGTLQGTAAERLFLTLMIAHHRGGIEMANAVLTRSEDPVVSRLATTMVQAQQAELTAMSDLLATRGGPLT